jgi:hypothetical protein
MRAARSRGTCPRFPSRGYLAGLGQVHPRHNVHSLGLQHLIAQPSVTASNTLITVDRGTGSTESGRIGSFGGRRTSATLIGRHRSDNTGAGLVEASAPSVPGHRLVVPAAVGYSLARGCGRGCGSRAVWTPWPVRREPMSPWWRRENAARGASEEVAVDRSAATDIGI